MLSTSLMPFTPRSQAFRVHKLSCFGADDCVMGENNHLYPPDIAHMSDGYGPASLTEEAGRESPPPSNYNGQPLPNYCRPGGL
jgi:hypothetical protein